MEDRAIPRTRLTVFLHFFGLVVGAWGILSHVQAYVLIGGACCLLIDVVRIIEAAVVEKRFSNRLWIYVAALVFVVPFQGSLLGFAYAALAVSAIIFGWDALISFPRKKRLTVERLAKASATKTR
jgi:hypothetical protein